MDERGRLFGRINLIDAIIALVVVGLIPLAYGAFLVFRPPQPMITSITPAQVFEHQQSTLHITGADLRPFLTIKVGNQGAFGFLVLKPTEGEVTISDLPPGTYDVVLLDRGQELARKTKGLTVLAVDAEANQIAPSNTTATSHVVSLQAVGRFIGLTRDTAGLIRGGAKFDLSPPSSNRPPIVDVVSVRSIEPATRRVRTGDYRFVLIPLPGEYQVPATLRLRCVVGEADCKLGETSIVQNSVLTLAARDGNESVNRELAATRFVIDEVRLHDRATSLPAADQKAVLTIRVRFVAPAEMVDLLHPGDTDLPGRGALDDEEQARVIAVGTERQPTAVTVQVDGGQVQQEMVAFTATLQVPAAFLAPGPSSAAGWIYKGRLVRMGLPFLFETLAASMTGSIQSVQTP